MKRSRPGWERGRVLLVPGMTRKERFAAQVFYCFDTLLPRYQWRHAIKEVESWFVEEALDPVLHVHSFYIASSVPVPGEHGPGESVAGEADRATRRSVAAIAS